MPRFNQIIANNFTLSSAPALAMGHIPSAAPYPSTFRVNNGREVLVKIRKFMLTFASYMYG